MACRQGKEHTRTQLLALIRQVLQEHTQAGTPLFPLNQATALLHDFVCNSGSFTEVKPEVYQVETVIWLQHLAGAALADQPTSTALGLTDHHVFDFLDKKAWDPDWEPVLKSWVSQAQDPLPLLKRLAKPKLDDIFRHRLGVAGRRYKQ